MNVGALFCKVDINVEEGVFERLRTGAAAKRSGTRPRFTAHRVHQGGKYSEAGDPGFQTYVHRARTCGFAQGVLVASYRMASIAALGMASLRAAEDGERGRIVLTSSAAAQDGQVGQVAYGLVEGGASTACAARWRAI